MNKKTLTTNQTGNTIPYRQGIFSNNMEIFSSTGHRYYLALPHNINIFKNVELEIDKIEALETKKHVVEFLNIFKRSLYELYQNEKIDSNLPLLHLSSIEDGGVVLQWNHKDFRIGFAFELKISESSYYFISEYQDKNRYITESGPLERKSYKPLIEKMMKYVLEIT